MGHLVTEPSHAVFLSYASQDAEAAQKICEALRAAGIEVWFDQSALRGGDVWDQTIRKQIRACVLFIPVISRHTHERDEGYFRLEWKLAVDRSHLMTTDKAFLLPVVIDDTREDDERVPDKFRDVHWTRLPSGETPPAFVERVRRLVSPEPTHGSTLTGLRAGHVPGAATTTHAPVRSFWRSKSALPVIAAIVLAGAVAYFAIDKFWLAKRQSLPPTSPAAFAPPPHSIAVLPFVNMSGDKEQEYFSDGLTEEILNSLARINELQVSARTSSFYFKGKDAELSTIAHKLNVASVLEGSVRRAGTTVRITAQLNNAITGFHLWSQTYDRDLSDVLKLQTEIAAAVAAALKVTLLGDVGAKIELGGTRNSTAFDAYLRGSNPLSNTVGDAAGLQAAIAAFTEAIRLDPDYALAFADRALALGRYASENGADSASVRAGLDKAVNDARRAIKLAPELAEGYRALAYVESATQQYAQASEAIERALALAPGNAQALSQYSRFAAFMGRADTGIAVGRRAVALDPLNSNTHFNLGFALYLARRYVEAMAALDGALALEPDNARTIGLRGLAYYLLPNLQVARSSCEAKPDHWFTQWCLAVVYDKLGRHADAEAELATMKATTGDTSAYQYATIYAQWGNTPNALDWLDTALRVGDPGLIFLKTDPLMDSLRNEPHFQAVMRELKFPE